MKNWEANFPYNVRFKANLALERGQGTQASCHENVEYLDHLDHLPPYFTLQDTQDDQGTQDHQGRRGEYLALSLR